MMRSWLFVPANHPGRMAKALSLGVDVTVLDLEDACAEADKDAARDFGRAALDGPRRGLAYVRINALATGRAEADLQAVVGAGLDGVMLPKVEDGEALCAASDLIARLEQRCGLALGAVDLIPLIETAAGAADIRRIASACPRVRRFAFGAVDFALDLGLQPGPEELELLPYRAALVLAARVEGLEPPIDAAWLGFEDLDAVHAAARRSKAMGFQGKLCIHPAQVDAVNAAFAPTETELARAERIVAAFQAAEAKGSAAIAVDGELVDYPVFRRAKLLLSGAGVASAI